MTTPALDDQTLCNSVVQLADDHLILGHRLSEWCGHAPMLEEDLAMPNMALDLLGQARALYAYAAILAADGRSEDDFAYLRADREYTNCLLVERPNVDFAHTMARQLYFAAFMRPFWDSMQTSPDETLRGIAGKAVKEIGYHIRHAGEWVIRLGDGTELSAARMQSAIDALHPYTDELFSANAQMRACIKAGVITDPASLREQWQETLTEIFTQAMLTIPDVPHPRGGGRDGNHTEEFGFLLCELQFMQRAYPGAVW